MAPCSCVQPEENVIECNKELCTCTKPCTGDPSGERLPGCDVSFILKPCSSVAEGESETSSTRTVHKLKMEVEICTEDLQNHRPGISMTSLIRWNIGVVVEKNPDIDIKKALNDCQTKLDVDRHTGRFRLPRSVAAVECSEVRHLSCALLAWQAKGERNIDNLLEFAESIKTETKANMRLPYRYTTCKTSFESSYETEKTGLEFGKSITKTFLCTSKPCGAGGFSSGRKKGQGSKCEIPKKKKSKTDARLASDQKRFMESIAGPVIKLPDACRCKMKSSLSKASVRINAPEKNKSGDFDPTSKPFSRPEVPVASCLEGRCMERLKKLDAAMASLRERAARLAKRDTERAELLERAEQAWTDMEQGFVKRLQQIEEREDDLVDRMAMLVEERAKFKNSTIGGETEMKTKEQRMADACTALCSLARESEDIEGTYASLEEQVKTVEAALEREEAEVAYAQRDLIYSREQLGQQVRRLTEDISAQQSLTKEIETTIRDELESLRSQFKSYSNKVLKSDDANKKTKDKIEQLRAKRDAMAKTLTNCKKNCEQKFSIKQKEIVTKKQKLDCAEQNAVECTCKLPKDFSVQVKRTPSVAIFCRCKKPSEDPKCSCVSLRTRMMSELVRDLFTGVKEELAEGVKMSCELLKCLDDSHDWSKDSPVKTKLSKYFMTLLKGELDTAIYTAIEHFRAKWINESCVDREKHKKDPAKPNQAKSSTVVMRAQFTAVDYLKPPLEAHIQTIDSIQRELNEWEKKNYAPVKAENKILPLAKSNEKDREKRNSKLNTLRRMDQIYHELKQRAQVVSERENKKLKKQVDFKCAVDKNTQINTLIEKEKYDTCKNDVTQIDIVSSDKKEESETTRFKNGVPGINIKKNEITNEEVQVSDGVTATMAKDDVWNKTQEEMIELKHKLSELKRETISRKDLKIMEKNLAKLVQSKICSEHNKTPSREPSPIKYMDSFQKSTQRDRSLLKKRESHKSPLRLRNAQPNTKLAAIKQQETKNSRNSNTNERLYVPSFASADLCLSPKSSLLHKKISSQYSSLMSNIFLDCENPSSCSESAQENTKKCMKNPPSILKTESYYSDCHTCSFFMSNKYGESTNYYENVNDSVADTTVKDDYTKIHQRDAVDQLISDCTEMARHSIFLNRKILDKKIHKENEKTIQFKNDSIIKRVSVKNTKRTAETFSVLSFNTSESRDADVRSLIESVYRSNASLKLHEKVLEIIKGPRQRTERERQAHLGKTMKNGVYFENSDQIRQKLRFSNSIRYQGEKFGGGEQPIDSMERNNKKRINNNFNNSFNNSITSLFMARLQNKKKSYNSSMVPFVKAARGGKRSNNIKIEQNRPPQCAPACIGSKSKSSMISSSKYHQKCFPNDQKITKADFLKLLKQRRNKSPVTDDCDQQRPSSPPRKPSRNDCDSPKLRKKNSKRKTSVSKKLSFKCEDCGDVCTCNTGPKEKKMRVNTEKVPSDDQSGGGGGGGLFDLLKTCTDADSAKPCLCKFKSLGSMMIREKNAAGVSGGDRYGVGPFRGIFSNDQQPCGTPSPYKGQYYDAQTGKSALEQGGASTKADACADTCQEECSDAAATKKEAANVSSDSTKADGDSKTKPPSSDTGLAQTDTSGESFLSSLLLFLSFLSSLFGQSKQNKIENGDQENGVGSRTNSGSLGKIGSGRGSLGRSGSGQNSFEKSGSGHDSFGKSGSGKDISGNDNLGMGMTDGENLGRSGISNQGGDDSCICGSTKGIPKSNASSRDLCTCCPSKRGSISGGRKGGEVSFQSDLEVNAFDLLQKYIKMKIRKMKCSCCPDDNPNFNEKNMYLVMLEKIQDVISSDIERLACRCSNEEEDCGEAAFSLLEEYLRSKIEQIKCRCSKNREEPVTSEMYSDTLDSIRYVIEKELAEIKCCCNTVQDNCPCGSSTQLGVHQTKSVGESKATRDEFCACSLNDTSSKGVLTSNRSTSRTSHKNNSRNVSINNNLGEKSSMGGRSEITVEAIWCNCKSENSSRGDSVANKNSFQEGISTKFNSNKNTPRESCSIGSGSKSDQRRCSFNKTSQKSSEGGKESDQNVMVFKDSPSRDSSPDLLAEYVSDGRNNRCGCDPNMKPCNCDNFSRKRGTVNIKEISESSEIPTATIASSRKSGSKGPYVGVTMECTCGMLTPCVCPDDKSLVSKSACECVKGKNTQQKQDCSVCGPLKIKKSSGENRNKNEGSNCKACGRIKRH